MKIFYAAIFLAASVNVYSQTLSDGLMMSKNNLCTGFLYGHDQWKNYWEGTLKRDNQNIGNLITESITWVGVYGLGEKVILVATLPYISTKASGGTLAGMKGVQDLTIGGKYRILRQEVGSGKLALFAAGSISTPMSDYTPDFFPLSLGTSSTNVSGRFIAGYRLQQGIYVNGTAAYTWRSNVALDRPSYYTDNTFYETNEVKMPNVFDYSIEAGYHKKDFQAALTYMQQNTLGGGDIRRQDMPFVSNQMNASRLGALIMYYLPKPKNLAVRLTGSYIVAGRNVGQTTSFMGGLLYTFKFAKEQ
jgi:hypothetical protein